MPSSKSTGNIILTAKYTEINVLIAQFLHKFLRFFNFFWSAVIPKALSAGKYQREPEFPAFHGSAYRSIRGAPAPDAPRRSNQGYKPCVRASARRRKFKERFLTKLM